VALRLHQHLPGIKEHTRMGCVRLSEVFNETANTLYCCDSLVAAVHCAAKASPDTRVVDLTAKDGAP
jgi:hypothetical protein